MEFDFSTSGTLDNLDSVPENFRGVYTQGADGKYVINETLKGVTDAVVGLNKALVSERKVTGALKSQKDVGAAVSEALREFDRLLPERAGGLVRVEHLPRDPGALERDERAAGVAVGLREAGGESDHLHASAWQVPLQQ